MTTHILFTRSRLAERYDRSVASVKRWERNGHIPKPDGFIFDEPFWRPETVEQIDANLSNAPNGRAAGYIKGRGAA